jgi:hypothetical protein
MTPPSSKPASINLPNTQKIIHISPYSPGCPRIKKEDEAVGRLLKEFKGKSKTNSHLRSRIPSGGGNQRNLTNPVTANTSFTGKARSRDESSYSHNIGSVTNSMTPRISRSKASSTDLKNKSIDSGMTPGSSYKVTEKKYGGSRGGKANKNL